MELPPLYSMYNKLGQLRLQEQLSSRSVPLSLKHEPTEASAGRRGEGGKRGMGCDASVSI